METTIHLSDAEVSDLKDLTREGDTTAALRTALVEYIRYAKRMRLKELSGRVEIEDNWQTVERMELEEAERDQNGFDHR